MCKYSVCGIDCSKCEVGHSNGCLGCQKMFGKVFWGSCDLYSCVSKNKLEHCGKCHKFPCDTLKEWATGENPRKNSKLD